MISMISQGNLGAPQIPHDSKSEWSPDVHQHPPDCKGTREKMKAI